MPRKRHTEPKALPSQKTLDLTQVEFVVTNEQKGEHSEEVYQILDIAIPLLHARDGEAAEVLFRQAMEIEANKPDLVNNLAASLVLQDRQAEATAMLEVLHYFHPNYFFCPNRSGQGCFARGRPGSSTGASCSFVGAAQISRERIRFVVLYSN